MNKDGVTALLQGNGRGEWWRGGKYLCRARKLMMTIGASDQEREAQNNYDVGYKLKRYNRYVC